MSVEEEAAPATLSVKLVVWVFVAVLLLAMTLAWVFLATRAVAGVGGSCASGGAYEIANPCPDGTWLLAPAVFVMLIASLSGSGAGSDVGAPNLLVPMWGLLFGLLTWNFVEFGLFHGGVDWALLVCGLMSGALAFPALLPTKTLFRADAWRGAPGRPALWWWTGCYLGLFSVGASLGVLTYSLIS